MLVDTSEGWNCHSRCAISRLAGISDYVIWPGLELNPDRSLTAQLRNAIAGTSRILRVVISLPRALLRASRYSRRVIAAFDAAVAPLIDGVMNDNDRRILLKESLRAWSVKGSHLMASYAELTRVDFPAEIAALGCSLARLYDDLLDDADPNAHVIDNTPTQDPVAEACILSADAQLQDLLLTFSDHLRNAMEPALVEDLLSDFIQLHSYQLRSCRPRHSGAVTGDLGELTAGKGGLSLLILLSLTRTALHEEDRLLILRLGAHLQLIDDLLDAEPDLVRNARNSVTEAAVGIADVFRCLRHLESSWRGRYGDRASEFYDDIYIFLGVCALTRYRPRQLSFPRLTGHTKSPLRVLLERGGVVTRC